MTDILFTIGLLAIGGIYGGVVGFMLALIAIVLIYK